MGSRLPKDVFGEVLHEVSFLRYAYVALKAVLLNLHVKLAQLWTLIQVKQENGPKVGDGHSFVGGFSFARLR